jgi:hypothetical protein
MWLQNDEIKTIQQVIREKKRPLLSRLLLDVLKEGPIGETLADCPVCRQKLVSKAFPYLEFFVKACPNQHGLWMSSEVCTKMRGFVMEQIAGLARRQHQLKISFVLASVLLMLNLVVHASNPVGGFVRQRVQALEDRRISQDHWPMRVSRDYFPLPIRTSVIREPEELFYFQQLLDFLGEALSHRINIDAVLKTKKKPEAYWTLYDFYREQQAEAAGRLDQMQVPEKLRPFHEKITGALRRQIDFYASFTEEKAKDPSAGLKTMAGDRSLEASNQLLREAHALLLEIYPHLDKETRLAVDSRLIWLEIDESV